MQRFDVFLSHNSRDKPVVERIAERLKREGLEPWLDKWCLVAGADWQRGLADGIAASRSCAVFVGPSDLGAWANQEVAVALDRAAKDAEFRLFLVLLPGLPEQFDAANLLPFLRMRTWVDYRAGLDDGRAYRTLVRAIQGLPLGPDVPVEARDEVPPYRGLAVFEEDHAELFFGREADVQRLLEELKGPRFLAVLGDSGSGKSSLVRAGVIPALRRGAPSGSDRWEIVVLRPGGHPLEALAARLLRMGAGGAMQQTLDGLAADPRTLHLAASLALAENGDARALFVIDQFEEVFTLCSDETERQAFFANLLFAASVPEGRGAVLLTMRADFYHRCGAYPELAQELKHQYMVSPLQSDGLRQAIEEPARAVGLTFEPGLVATIMDDVADEPGALPLLEHALLELWERRRGGMLTLEGYRESGGVGGAIAQRAEEVFQSMDAAEREVARRTFLRLTQPGEGTQDTRRRARIGELGTGSVGPIVGSLVNARLLTTTQDEAGRGEVVEVAHEALIRGWPRLRQWIDEDRAGLRVHRRLTEASEEWQRLERDPGTLYRGARLAEAEEWREANEEELNDAEREFLQASRAAEQDALEQERRRSRRLRALAGSLAALLVAAVAAGGYALQQRNQATAQERVARSRALASAAIANVDSSPALAMLMGLEAFRLVEDSSPEKRFEARDSVLTALQRHPRLTGAIWGLGPSSVIAFSPNGKLLASGGADRTVRLWDVDSRASVGEPLLLHKKAVTAIAFSADGKTIASGGRDQTVRLWDVKSGSAIGEPLPGHSYAVVSVAFDPIGQKLASADLDGNVRLWDVERRERIGEPFGGVPGGAAAALTTGIPVVLTMAFSPDGNALATSGARGIKLWDLRGPMPVPQRLSGADLADQLALNLAFSAGGETLITADVLGTVRSWDMERRAPVGKPLHIGNDARLTLSPDGTKVAAEGKDGTASVWDVARQTRLADELGVGEAVSIVFSADGKTLASVAQDKAIRLWNVGERTAFTKTLRGVDSTTGDVFFNPDDKTLVTIGDAIRIWDVARRAPLGEAFARDEAGAQLSPDGKTLATSGGWTEMVRLWDLDKLAPIGEPLKGHTEPIMGLAFSPDGKTLASGSRDHTIRLWDVARRSPIGKPLKGHELGVIDLAFSPEGNLLASGGEEGALRLWDVDSRSPRGKPFLEHAVAASGSGFVGVNSVAFSPDGKLLASGGDDSMVRLWDVPRHAPLGPLRGHGEPVRDLAFTPDGSTLASVAGDGTIRLWDVGRRAPLGAPFSAPEVQAIAMSPDSRTFAIVRSGQTVTGTVELWDVVASSEFSPWQSRLCPIIGRNLTETEWRQFASEPRRKTCPQYP